MYALCEHCFCRNKHHCACFYRFSKKNVQNMEFSFFFMDISLSLLLKTKSIKGTMYKLCEYIPTITGKTHVDLMAEDFFCLEADKEKAKAMGRLEDAEEAYGYTLVVKGTLIINYNQHLFTLSQGDIFLYSPGFRASLEAVSDDYYGYCLIVDENVALSNSTVRTVVCKAGYPVAEAINPVLHLSENQTRAFLSRMKEMENSQSPQTLFRTDRLRLLYSLFILELMEVIQKRKENPVVSVTTSKAFLDFLTLLTHNFTVHHDIAFYADQLCITTTHLSRIVRQITGRTVVDYINRMLLMEASWLLQNTSLSIQEIAERLNFATQSTFTRFFSRLKGTSPKAFRDAH